MGYILPRSLQVVTEIGVADVLADVPQPVEFLAQHTGANPGALNRAMRLLCAHGVFAFHDGLYSHTELSRLLRSDHPMSLRGLVRLQGIPALWNIWSHLEHSLRTGETAAPLVLPDGYWGHLAHTPRDRQIFDDAMEMKVKGQTAGILAAYQFSDYQVIADIGGGQGHLLHAILQATPKARGVLFDLPEAVRTIEPSEQLQIQAGSFFEDALPSADLYLLTQVLHNWGDEQALKILKAIHRAAPKNAKVLLIEWLVPDDGRPSWVLFADMIMLTEFTGQERTQGEFRDMLASAGFELTRVMDCGSRTFILEAQAL